MDCRDQLASLAGNGRCTLASKARAAVVCIGIAASSFACRATLDGYLVDEAGQAITSGEARVNLIALKGEQKDQTTVLTVDSDGYFATDRELGQGLYFVEALVPGYKIQSLRFHLAAPQSLQLKLEPLPKAQNHGLRANREVHDERGSGGVTLNPPEL